MGLYMVDVHKPGHICDKEQLIMCVLKMKNVDLVGILEWPNSN